MLSYIDTFPERYHHPKEDAYLFKRLLARCPEAQPVIAALETEHRDGAVKIRELAQALERYRTGGHGQFLPFASAVEAYARSTGRTCAPKKIRCCHSRARI